VGVYITMCGVRWLVLEVSMDVGDAVCMLVRSRHVVLNATMDLYKSWTLEFVVFPWVPSGQKVMQEYLCL